MVDTDPAGLSSDVANPRVKTAERIARHIVDLVAEGSLSTGDQLPAEPDLIAQLGVSRGSVREALRLLEATGVLELRQGRNGGAFISHAGAPEFANTSTLYLQLAGATYGDLLEARLMIEPGLAAHAALRRDEDDLTRLRAHLDAVRSFDAGSPTLRAPSVVRFHTDLLRASGNRALALYVGAMASVWAKRHATVIVAVEAVGHSRDNETRLAVLLSAVESKDDTAASEAMTAYLDRIRSAVETGHPGFLEETVLWGGPRK